MSDEMGLVRIEHKADVYVRGARRVFVQDSIEVVVLGCKDVQLKNNTVAHWNNNSFAPGGSGNVFLREEPQELADRR